MESHMLANFSSYLQFLDAIFVSMLLDEVFHFWNPRFNKIYEQADARLNKSSPLSRAYLEEPLNKMRTTTNDVSEEFYHSIRKRAAIMLIFTTLLLLFCGLETHIGITSFSPIYRSVAISSFILFCCIAISLNKYIKIKGNKISVIYLGYIIGVISVIIFYHYFEPIAAFVINHRFHLILAIAFFFALFLILSKRKKEHSSSKEQIMIFDKFYFPFFTIVPLLLCNYIFQWCQEKPLYFILGFCTWEILWEWFLSRYYGKIYPEYIENKINEAFTFIEENKNLKYWEIKERINKMFKLTIAEDEQHSKFYLFNWDVWINYKYFKFLIKLFK